MPGDIFIIDTKCALNETIEAAFKSAGLSALVQEVPDDVTDDILKNANGFQALCIFVNKKIGANQVEILKANGNKLILCCSAGFDNVPLDEVKAAGIRVGRVPSYSPASIAEFAISNIMALAKNVQKSFVYSKEANFSIKTLQCTLLQDKTAGVIGTGMIGKLCVEKLSGLVKEVLCYDAFQSPDWIKTVKNAKYVEVDELLAKSKFISIHVPLLPETKYMISEENINKMQDGVILVNTSRGEIVKTPDLIKALKSGKVSGAALDVFEGEKNFIFQDKTKTMFEGFADIAELAKMDNVIISSHIAFYTDEAIRQITNKTLENYLGFIGKGELDNNAFLV